MIVATFFLPLYSLPLVFFQIVKRKQKVYFTILAFIFGLIGYTSAPTGDLYRHYLEYFNFSTRPMAEITEYIVSGLDFVVQILILISAELSIGIQWISFLAVFVTYYIIFTYFIKITLKNDKLNSTNVVYLLFLLTLIFSQNFLIHSLKLRAPLGQALLLVFFSKLLIENRTDWKYFIFAVITHFSSLITLPIALAAKYMSYSKLRNLFIFSVFLIPFSKKIVLLFYDLIDPIVMMFPQLHRQVGFYVDGYWAFDYFSDLTTNALVQYYISVVPYFIVMLYFIVSRYKSSHRKVIYSYFILLNSVYSFTNIFNRFFTLAVVLGIFVIMIEYGRRPKIIGQKVVLLSMFIATFIYFGINILAQRRPLKIAFTKEMLYRNSFSIIFHTYSESWIDERVDKEGFIIGDSNKAKSE